MDDQEHTARLDALTRTGLDDTASAEAALDALPWLGAAIDQDRAHGLFPSWGRSLIIDEHADAPLLPRAVFDALHARAGLPAAWPIGNAGLLHVYGYLLSTTPTPYGLKRDRWLDGGLARACGRDATAFLPWTGAGTLLRRVTEAARRVLAESTVRTPSVDGTPTRIALRRTPDPAAPAALVYEVGHALLTMFPVADPSALLAEVDAEPHRLRWNAAPPADDDPPR